MNSTINKIFYTCCSESLFLRYKKISKKAIKVGVFLQWAYIYIYFLYIYFLGMMTASEKLKYD